MNLTAIAQKVFCNDLFATQTTGIEILAVDENRTVCQLALSDAHRNAKGNVMGGVIFTLADFAFAIAANAHILALSTDGEIPVLQWVSASSNIHFLTAPKGNTLTATTSVVRQGRSQAVFQINVTDSEQRCVALVTTSGAKIVTCDK